MSLLSKSMELDSFPVWIAPELNSYVNNVIKPCFTNHKVYHPLLAPLPWAHALFSREGNQKMRALETIFKREGMNAYSKITVQLGGCKKALQEITITANMNASIKMENDDSKVENQPQTQAPTYIILVDHADILCYEPDGEESLLECTRLAALAKATNSIIICLFDRLPRDMALDRMSAWAKECHDKFFAQFRSTGFIPAPHATYRLELFKWCIDEWIKHLATQRPMICELTEPDFTNLVDYAAYDTPLGIIHWMQRVFLNMVERIEQNSINMDFLEGHLTLANQVYHINQGDVFGIEERFRQACAVGSLRVKKKKPVDAAGVQQEPVPPPEGGDGYDFEIGEGAASGFGAAVNEESIPHIALFSSHGATMDGAKEDMALRKREREEVKEEDVTDDARKQIKVE